MKIIEAKINDLEMLTKMNIQLRFDENMDNFMTDNEVKQRMNGFLEGNEYKTYLLEDNAQIIGYCLINIVKKPVYLRQIFIKSEYRSKGYGSDLIRKIVKELTIKEIDVEVMVWNEKAIRFYEKYGFKKRYIGLRYKE